MQTNHCNVSDLLTSIRCITTSALTVAAALSIASHPNVKKRSRRHTSSMNLKCTDALSRCGAPQLRRVVVRSCEHVLAVRRENSGKYKKSMALEATQALPRSEVTQLCRAVLGGCEHLLHNRRENTRNDDKSFMPTSTLGYSGRI